MRFSSTLTNLSRTLYLNLISFSLDAPFLTQFRGNLFTLQLTVYFFSQVKHLIRKQLEKERISFQLFFS